MRRYLSKLLALIGILASVLFLLNLSAGFVEIPDNLPIIGNLDEALATAILISCLSVFGIRLPMAAAMPKREKDRL